MPNALIWVIVNFDLLCVPFVALLAGDNHCIWGKKDRIMYCAKKVALSVRSHRHEMIGSCL